MKTIISYLANNGKTYSTPDEALSADNDSLCEEINEVIKTATVKDYFVPHAYLCQLVLAFAPMPKSYKYGTDIQSVKDCIKKVDSISFALDQYSKSLSSFLNIKKGKDDDDDDS